MRKKAATEQAIQRLRAQGQSVPLRVRKAETELQEAIERIERVYSVRFRVELAPGTTFTVFFEPLPTAEGNGDKA